MSITFDEFGRPCRRAIRKLAKFGEPLERLFGVDVFWQYTISENGEFSYLGNRPDICEFFFGEGLYLNHPHFRHPRFFQTGCALFNEESCKDFEMTQGKLQEEGFLDQILMIYQKEGRNLRAYGFATSKQLPSMGNVYLSNLPFFKRFTQSFQEYHNPLAHEAEECSANMLNILGSSFQTDPQLFKQRHDKTLIAACENDPIKINAMTSLSRRERETLYWVLRGRSAPEIAQLLHLSPRTIESHVDNIRNKCGVEKKSELFDLFLHLQDHLLLGFDTN